MRLLITVISLVLSTSSWSVIFDLAAQKELTKAEFLAKTSPKHTIVLGEYHYQFEIQRLQGEIIADVVKHHQGQDNFSLAWEFFEYDLNQTIQSAFSDYSADLISSNDFLRQSFPNSKDPLKYGPYLKSINATKKLKGSIISTNATRAVKSILMAQGRSSLEAKDLPLIYPEATPNYFNRFKIAMGGHVDDQALKKYFKAQHYTDVIIASKMSEARQELSFLIVGAFHSDYNDGVVRALKMYNEDVLTIKIIDIKQTKPQELIKLKVAHPNYGYIADYLLY
jgi:uncharacterized iron-regulated protein